MTDKQALKEQVEHQADRIDQAERSRSTVLSQTIYLGTLGLLLVLPIVVGAYLGQWLDKREGLGFSTSWTISLILLGVFIGAMNVYLFIKRN
ncbi:AtpZ/AtpI family protein [Thiomicrorhabdus sp. zzn3]|uniref:AtpZ/AtpI family protein n=1 Tax=Thiomicrorhabdus sp. zzn3 TaxID=3039775 RepID=UPI0024373D0C|nr:AtpZ/AtpI family protein [Thiomicrorhabdus sp. zzn3]MDG6778811.1 AtpZ/AtpI family protein [Thiomicrorhabdus sp. zzn3]